VAAQKDMEHDRAASSVLGVAVTCGLTEGAAASETHTRFRRLRRPHSTGLCSLTGHQSPHTFPMKPPDLTSSAASLRRVAEALLSAARDPATCWTPPEAVRLRCILNFQILSRLAPPSKQ
jgi:hypothetical protein